MAGSRKRPSGEVEAAVARSLAAPELRGRRLSVALSGGIDSVVLLHAAARLGAPLRLSALHVNHGLSPNAGEWARFCRRVCRRLGVPLAVRRVKVERAGEGLEAAARKARYAAFDAAQADALALAHNLDDQAETVLMNLLRGAGARGAAGMPARASRKGKLLLRPLLDVPRESIAAYAAAEGLEWVVDESNADESLTRNFVRLRLGPLVAARFPGWKRSLARAARHFSRRELEAGDLLREFLRARGLRAPSEAKLVEMLKQLRSGGARTRVAHDGAALEVYRGRLRVSRPEPAARFEPAPWRGERRLPLPALGGEMRFRRSRGEGIDAGLLEREPWTVRLRGGGERLQTHPRRPRRTLKNLFQEAGVPPSARERLPLLYCGERLAWAPGLGTDVRFRAPPEGIGLVPEWRRRATPGGAA